MNAFEFMIDDVFNVPEFMDNFSFSSSESSASGSSLQSVTCIQYTAENDALYTEFGIDDNIDFILTCKTADFTPFKNQKIMFHGKQYKIVSWKTDGFNLTHNLNVKSITSK